MKKLQIRLDDEDLKRIEELKRIDVYFSNTINGTIRRALKQSIEYLKLVDLVRHAIKYEPHIDPKDIEKLQNKLPA